MLCFIIPQGTLVEYSINGDDWYRCGDPITNDDHSGPLVSRTCYKSNSGDSGQAALAWYVRVIAPGTDQHLSVCEIRVCGQEAPKNLLIDLKAGGDMWWAVTDIRMLFYPGAPAQHKKHKWSYWVGQRFKALGVPPPPGPACASLFALRQCDCPIHIPRRRLGKGAMQQRCRSSNLEERRKS